MYRNLTIEMWRKIFSRNEKENINYLFGVTKETFLATVVGILIFATAFLAFLETSSQSKETADTNLKTSQLLQRISDRLGNDAFLLEKP